MVLERGLREPGNPGRRFASDSRLFGREDDGNRRPRVPKANQPHHRNKRGAIEPLDLCGRRPQLWRGDDIERRQVGLAGDVAAPRAEPETRAHEEDDDRPIAPSDRRPAPVDLRPAQRPPSRPSISAISWCATRPARADESCRRVCSTRTPDRRARAPNRRSARVAGGLPCLAFVSLIRLEQRFRLAVRVEAEFGGSHPVRRWAACRRSRKRSRHWGCRRR